MKSRKAEFKDAMSVAMSKPEAQASISRRELVTALWGIANRSVTTANELAVVEAESYILGERIRRTPELHNVPHELWHFLHDADIRFKDARYREAQLAAMGQWMPSV